MRRKTTAVRIGNVVLSSEDQRCASGSTVCGRTGAGSIDAEYVDPGGGCLCRTGDPDYRGRWPAGEDYCSGSEGSGDARGNTPSFA